MSRRSLLMTGASFVALNHSPGIATAQVSAWFEVAQTVIKAIGDNASYIFGYFSTRESPQSELCLFPVNKLLDLETRLYRLALSIDSLDGEPYGDVGDEGLLKAIKDYSQNPSKKNLLRLRDNQGRFFEAATLYILEIISSERLMSAVQSQYKPANVASITLSEAVTLRNALENLQYLMRTLRSDTKVPEISDLTRLNEPLRIAEFKVRNAWVLIKNMVREREKVVCK
ncbi:hypothetical protein [Methylobacterium aquaticum]|uniref:hypothetical protein n=1 Tax=Methylobacterium aquaticum TaxID=270351 RepID=UPI0019322132|nr:hypothetical protein [Methylobacterium aquaticum]QRE76992.1 hypothetical protein F1D61_28660 [Methylobacterium aquaticum]